MTKYDHENHYSKKKEYYLNGQKVGERGWWISGHLAYETPIKNGHKHGLVRGWYDNGKLWQEIPYKNGRLHGVYKSWNKKGKVDISFWIDGGNVPKDAYLLYEKTDQTLPKYLEDMNCP